MQKQLLNYEFPTRVWLLKESNRSPLDTQLFALFLLLRFILTEREKKNSHRRRHQCHRRPNRAHRSLENFKQQHANGEKKKKKVIWQFLWSFFFFPSKATCSSSFSLLFLMMIATRTKPRPFFFFLTTPFLRPPLFFFFCVYHLANVFDRILVGQLPTMRIYTIIHIETFLHGGGDSQLRASTSLSLSLSHNTK